jgi:hypothetical protein
MSLSIPLPIAARRNRSREYELAQEAAMPLDQELPSAITVRDVGEERAIRDAWYQCGRQVLRALNNRGNPHYVESEYERTKRTIIELCTRPERVLKQPYDIADRPVIMAMARFSMQPPYEHPLVEMDRQLAGSMLDERQADTKQLEHATI